MSGLAIINTVSNRYQHTLGKYLLVVHSDERKYLYLY